eukprot:CAMPEP_0179844520 /NCGR_PEP_ID=MMETSP0982-20121206/4390_1 /TAXON_ID=483367 /ORGANISM="non described non described, Strain CCMP 2436" /LENGTH=189 /DNA_ID=CAMNT_0021729237 /DNA_START=189 /DNA_END=759 /DNA_ORIENTATION=+
MAVSARCTRTFDECTGGGEGHAQVLSLPSSCVGSELLRRQVLRSQQREGVCMYALLRRYGVELMEGKPLAPPPEGSLEPLLVHRVHPDEEDVRPRLAAGVGVLAEARQASAHASFFEQLAVRSALGRLTRVDAPPWEDKTARVLADSMSITSTLPVCTRTGVHADRSRAAATPTWRSSVQRTRHTRLSR